RQGIRLAVLKARSPSCGNLESYDGSFTGRKVAGEGVTAPLLRRAGWRGFYEVQLGAAAGALAGLDRCADGATQPDSAPPGLRCCDEPGCRSSTKNNWPRPRPHWRTSTAAPIKRARLARSGQRCAVRRQIQKCPMQRIGHSGPGGASLLQARPSEQYAATDG